MAINLEIRKELIDYSLRIMYTYLCLYYAQNHGVNVVNFTVVRFILYFTCDPTLRDLSLGTTLKNRQPGVERAREFT